MNKNIQILVNFKLHKNGCGENALKLAKVCEKVAKETNVNIVIAVNYINLEQIANSVSIPVFAQHVDAITSRSATGKIPAQMIKEAGATGTLLNHAEHSIKEKTFKKTLEQAKAQNLDVIFCTKSPRESKKIAKLHNSIKPKYIAYEPIKLIGSSCSITEKEPKKISKTNKITGKTNLMVGAGIKTPKDIKNALSLGATGILIASVITKSETPYKTLTELANAFKNNKTK